MPEDDETSLRRYLVEDKSLLESFLSEYKQFRSTECLVTLTNTRLPLATPYDIYSDYTPLGYAIVENDSNTVHLLLRNGACAQTVPCTSADDAIVILSPLHLALKSQCQPKIVDTLCKYGATTADVLERDMSCLLEYLVNCSSKVTTSALLSGVSSFELSGENKKRTLLHLAAIKCNGAFASSVLDTGQVNVDKFDAIGKTALMYAAEHNAPAVVLLLLDGGATVDLIDAWGRTALHFAVRRACLKTVELLLSSGADVTAEDKKGLTPLAYALSDEKLLHTRSPKESVEDLMGCLVRSNGKPISLSKRNFVEIVFLMAEMPETESAIIKLLEDNSCHVSLTSDAGQMLMHVASEFSKQRVVKWLVEDGGIDSEVPDDAGWLPLHYAAKGGNRETFFYLLNQHGADVNSATPSGWTPLWIAARNGWTDLACDVVRYGCDVERTLRVITLRLAPSEYKLPRSLFDPDAQRENPVAYARTGSRSLSIVDFCTECGFGDLTRLLGNAGYPESSYL